MGVVVIVPLVGISACSSMRCSPCSTMAGFTSMASPRLSMAGMGRLTAKVQHLQIALVGELEVVGAAADAERVEHHVALAVGVRHRAELLADGLQIDWHAGYLTSL